MKGCVKVIFSAEKLTFRIIDVLKIKQSDARRLNRERHFGAISFRKHSDAVIKCGYEVTRMRDGAVSYFPADVDYLRTAQYDEMIVVHFDVLNYSGNEIETYFTKDPEEVGALFEALFDEWSKNGYDKYYKVTAMFYDLFARLHRECRDEEGPGSKLALTVADYIHKKYSDPELTVKGIAQHLSVSEVYLRKMFHKKFGVSPNKYISNFRVKQASFLLAGGYHTVAEAAHLSGFDDEKYFSVVFKKATGCSPSKYTYRFYKDELSSLKD